MAPGGGKRKRGERQYSQDDGVNRPSPHRPENLNLAQQNQHHSVRGGRGGGGGRRQNRGGQGSQVSSAMSGPDSVQLASRASQSAASTPAPVSSAHQRGTPGSDRSSRPATPIQRVATPAQERPAGLAAPAAPYAYEYLTDGRVSSWHETGRRQVLDATKQDLGNVVVPSILVQELLRAGLDGKLDPAEAGATIKQMIVDAPTVDVQALFLDTISLLDDADTKRSALFTLMAATDIDPDIIRAELDVPLLQALSLVRNTFSHIRIRKTTNMLYRQANFNLLREETEGYSKLITEYFNTASIAMDGPAEGAEEAFQRVKALIGAFDLDVGRVLDVTLDVFANMLVGKYRFFVKLLRASSWWPEIGVLDNVQWEDQGFGTLPPWVEPGSGKWGSDVLEREQQAQLRELRDRAFWPNVRERGLDAFFELGARRIVDFDSIEHLLDVEAQPELDSKGKEQNSDRRKRINEARRYMKETRCLPPQGNPDAAQLLGFKLRYYASQARDAQDVWHDNLIHLAAFLIKLGFISLRDIYPHLWPPDEEMHEVRKLLEKEKEEREKQNRPGLGGNALTMASALPDDTIPVPGAGVRNLRVDAANSKAGTPKPEGTPKSTAEADDKELLPRPIDQKVLLIKGLLLHGMLPEALYMLGRFPWMMDVVDGLPAHFHRLLYHMLSKVAEETQPLADRTNLQDQRTQLTDTTAQPNALLPFASTPARKLLRWAQLERCNQGDSQEYKFFWDDWSDNVPVCQTVDDVFLLCDTLLNLSGFKIGQDPGLLIKLVRIGKKSLTEDTSESNRSRWQEKLKRLLVPALSFTKQNPGAQHEVWDMLKQYPNHVRYNIYAEWINGKTSRTPDMRAATTLTRFQAKEVLMRVTNEGGKKQGRALAKVTLSSPGVVLSMITKQLESMSNMISALAECTRYFSDMTYDVLIWSLLNSLSGQGRERMQADGMLTSSWLQAVSRFAGLLFARNTHLDPAPVLQYVATELRDCNSTDLEVLEQIIAEMAGIKSDMDYNEVQVLAMTGGELLKSQTVQQLGDTRHLHKASAERLVKALAEPQLTGQILILLAQEQQMYANRDIAKATPLKVLGSNMDKLQNVFLQYLEFLTASLKPNEFEGSIPDVAVLVGDFGIKPSTALTVWRAKIAPYWEDADVASRKWRQSGEESRSNGDTTMQEGDEVTNAGSPVKEFTMDAALSTPPQSDMTKTPWHPMLGPVNERLCEVAEDLGNRISIPFYTTFWTLTQSDIVAHADSYKVEDTKLNHVIRDINSDRSNLTARGAQDREKKVNGVLDLQRRLNDEIKAKIRDHKQVRDRLKKEKEHWFVPFGSDEKKEPRHVALLQECFLPRATMSPLDASYSVAMLKFMQSSGTPHFNTRILLEQLFLKQQLAAILYQCTTKEAENLGRFFGGLLKHLQSMHVDKTAYEKEALGSNRTLPGFAWKLGDDGTPETFVEYEEFRRLLFRWHGNLNAALKTCMESGEYMHIRNSITILKAVVHVFPAVNFMGKTIQDQVTKLSKEERRQDLKLAATSLIVDLRRREKDWVLPQAFRLNEPTKDGPNPASRATSANPETPGPDEKKAAPNATASEFKPSPTQLMNGNSREPSLISKGDAEDGEIEDDKPGEIIGGAAPAKDAAAAVEIKSSIAAHSQPPAKAPVQTDAQRLLPAKPLTPTLTPTPVPAKVDVKPSTPTPTPNGPLSAANGQSRSDTTRQQPSNRPSNTLPSRPEGPPSRPLPPVPGPRPSSRYPDARDGRDSYGRLDHPGDVRPPSSREHSPSSRGRLRSPDRGYHSDRERRDGPPSRSHIEDRVSVRPPPYDSRPSRHEGYDQRPPPSVNSRPPPDDRSRPNGMTSMPPPTQGVHPDPARIVGEDRSAPSIQPNSRPGSSVQPTTRVSQPEIPLTGVNPARLALINGDTASLDKPREAQTTDKRPSRPEPPRRIGDRPSSDYPQRLDNSWDSRGPPTPELAPLRDRRDQRDQPGDHAPTGPRDRRGSAAPSRDLFQGGNQPGNASESSRGRLSRENGATTQESSYGRLNAPPDVPSGPRQASNGPFSSGARTFTGPGKVNTSIQAPPQSPASTRPPESPAVFGQGPQRQPSRDMGPPPQAQVSLSSAPPTSATGSPMTGMHPDRMAQFGAKPPPIQTNMVLSGSAGATASPGSAPPAGPRGRASGPPFGTPTGPSPSNNGPPYGPALANLGGRRSDRRFANINNALQNATSHAPPAVNSSQGVNFRGASSRQTSLSQPSSAVAQAPPQAVASPIEPPARREPSSRQDGPPSRPESGADLFSRSTPADRGDNSDTRRRRDDDRSERHRSSRDPSHDRHLQRRIDERGAPRAPPPVMESGRDSRNSHLRNEEYREGPPRDRHGPSRNDDLTPRRPPPAQHNSFNGQPPDYDPRDGSRRQRDDGAEDSRRGGRGRGGGSGGAGDDYHGERRGGDERRDAGRPPRDDGRDSRKRRHDEGPDGDAKRRRSGPGR